MMKREKEDEDDKDEEGCKKCKDVRLKHRTVSSMVKRRRRKEAGEREG